MPEYKSIGLTLEVKRELEYGGRQVSMATLDAEL